MTLSQWLITIFSWIFFLIIFFLLYRKTKKIESDFSALSIAYKSSLKLIMAEKDRKRQHAKALQRLTDPEAILEDMERGAQIVEMRNAKRDFLPREDAGPPAKVFTPQLRAKVMRSSYKKKK